MMLSAILTAVLLFPVSNVIGTFCSAGTIGCALTMAMTASIMLIGGTVLLFLGFSMGLMVADVVILNVKK